MSDQDKTRASVVIVIIALYFLFLYGIFVHTKIILIGIAGIAVLILSGAICWLVSRLWSKE